MKVYVNSTQVVSEKLFRTMSDPSNVTKEEYGQTIKQEFGYDPFDHYQRRDISSAMDTYSLMLSNAEKEIVKDNNDAIIDTVKNICDDVEEMVISNAVSEVLKDSYKVENPSMYKMHSIDNFLRACVHGANDNFEDEDEEYDEDESDYEDIDDSVSEDDDNDED